MSCKLAIICLIVGAGAAASAQSVFYDGTGSPEGVGFALSGGSTAAGFQFDTPSPGELLIDTRVGSGFAPSDFAIYEIPRCSGDLDADDDFDADDANAAIAGVNAGDITFHRVAPFNPSPSDAFDLGVILADAAADICLVDPIEVVAGYTIEFAIKLLPGNEQVQLIVFEDVDDNPPDVLRPGTQGAFIRILFEGEGANASVQINESTDPEVVISLPAGDFDFSDFVTVQLLRRPTVIPIFPEIYDAELPELYIDGERINPAIPLLDLFDNPRNGIGLVKQPSAPDELVQFGDISGAGAAHAVIDFFNIMPGPTTVTELGACCLGGGACESLTEADCNTQGGAFTPDSGCSPAQGGGLNGCLVGACCLTDDSCVEAGGFEECADLSGSFQGFGVECAPDLCTSPDLVACCFPAGDFCVPDTSVDACTNRTVPGAEGLFGIVIDNSLCPAIFSECLSQLP